MLDISDPSRSISVARRVRIKRILIGLAALVVVCLLAVLLLLHLHSQSDSNNNILPAGPETFFVFDLDKDPDEELNIYEEQKHFAKKAYAELKSLTPLLVPVEWDAEFTDAARKQMESLQRDRRALYPYLENFWDPEAAKPPKKKWPDRERKPKLHQPNIVFVLVDDWGYNDHFYSSTMEPGATPTLDAWKAKGIDLKRYYTPHFCTPSRSAFLTGRDAFLVGMQQRSGHPHLTLKESTVFEELRSVGYHTAAVGKWDLGFQSWNYTPTWRGVDDYYGYWCGFTGFYNYLCPKIDMDPKLPDLHDGELPAKERYDGKHITQVLKEKAASIIERHASDFKGKPLLFYYPTMAMHFSENEKLENTMKTAPKKYLDMCTRNHTKQGSTQNAIDEARAYCANAIMLDEALADLECTLVKTGLANNTIIIISGDNGQLTGGPKQVQGTTGSNYPLAGGKTTLVDGGVRNTALVIGPSSLIPASKQGTTYDGLVHITDWLTTFMHLATEDWDGTLLSGKKATGFDIWPSLIGDSASKTLTRKKLILAWQPKGELDIATGQNWTNDFGAIIVENLKFIVNSKLTYKPGSKAAVPIKGREPPITFRVNTSQIAICNLPPLSLWQDSGFSTSPLWSQPTEQFKTNSQRCFAAMVASCAIFVMLVLVKFRHQYTSSRQEQEEENSEIE